MSNSAGSVAYDICRLYIQDETVLPSSHPLAIKALGYVRGRNLKGLATLEDLFSPVQHGRDELIFVRQVAAFFKKNAAFVNEDTCLSAAKESFLRAERACARANRRISFYERYPERNKPHLVAALKRMKKYIADVLGDFRPFLDELPRLIRYTEGASLSRSRRQSMAFLKVKTGMQCSYGARKYWNAINTHYGIPTVPLNYNCTPFNRIEFVPKNWKTHRTIACEPEGNIPLQLAWDTYVKSRLLRVGIDLSDQTRNQNLAKEGSLTNMLATVDMQMASDTLSEALVHSLLPDRWAAYLEDVRSRFYRSPFGVGKYAKFSSMGNGTTFGLETLIFAAAVHAVGSEVVSVYGDDIICESKVFTELTNLTRFLGLTINEEKSFVDGPFRESCGFDAYLGVNITPFYLRDESPQRQNMCHIVNGVLGLAGVNGALAKYCHDIVVKYSLPLVPYNADTTSGVFVSPSKAYELKLLRNSSRKFGRYVPAFRGLTSITRTREVRRSTTRFLHFLHTERCKSLVDERYLKLLITGVIRPWVDSLAESDLRLDEYVATSVRVSSRGRSKPSCKRDWVRWSIPTEAVPTHVYLWEDLVAA